MKTLLCLVLAGIVPVILNAQAFGGQSELSVSCGYVSMVQAGDAGFGIGGGDGYTETTSPGNFFLTYHYYPGGRIAVGLCVGTQTLDRAFYDDYHASAGPYSPYRLEQVVYSTLAGEFLFNYANRRNVRLYTMLGLGASAYSRKIADYEPGTNWIRSNEHGVMFNAQYVPIGIRIGRALSGFFELGLGYKGFFNGGISCRFPVKVKQVNAY